SAPSASLPHQLAFRGAEVRRQQIVDHCPNSHSSRSPPLVPHFAKWGDLATPSRAALPRESRDDCMILNPSQGRGPPSGIVAPMSPPAGSPPDPVRPAFELRTQRKQATRRSLQDAALLLFAEQGYEATSAVQIAEFAGVSVRTFFVHFPTKEHVLFGDA